MSLSNCFKANTAIENICNLGWDQLDADQLTGAAFMFYYRSIQFRLNYAAALRLHPDDNDLQQLATEEFHTNNLSPYPGIAEEGERMDHEEFLLRFLNQLNVPKETKQRYQKLGRSYLQFCEGMSDEVKAMCLVSSEDGGSKRIYEGMLKIPQEQWDALGLHPFKHFLEKHVQFDSEEGAETGHGALVKAIPIDDRVAPMLEKFYDSLYAALYDAPRHEPIEIRDLPTRSLEG